MKTKAIGVFVLCLCGPLDGQESAGGGTKLSPSDAKRLVAEFAGANAAKAAAAKEKLLAVPAEDRKQLFDLLAGTAWALAPGVKANREKSVVLEVETGESAVKKAPFVVGLPSKYDGKTPVPVLFRLHGSGDTAKEFASHTNSAPAFSKFLLVTPEIPSRERTGWNEEGAASMLDRIYRRVLKEWCVDPDRVYLTGYSAGGGASVYYAELWPHRVAGFYSMSRVHHKYHPAPGDCMDVLAHVPGYFVVGEDDTSERVSGYREAEAHFKASKFNGVFQFVKRKGHELMPEHDKEAVEFLGKSTRKRYPKVFSGLFFAYSNAKDLDQHSRRQYWLVGKEFDPNGTKVKVAVEGNVISLDAPKLRAGELLLNDAIVDLDQPVVVRLNGTQVSSAKVERSLPFFLEWFEQNRDRGDLYWNRVSFGR